MNTDEPKKTMRHEWFEHVRKTRKKMSKGKDKQVAHRKLAKAGLNRKKRFSRRRDVLKSGINSGNHSSNCISRFQYYLKIVSKKMFISALLLLLLVLFTHATNLDYGDKKSAYGFALRS